MVGLVVDRPERLVGGNGHEQKAARPADAAQLHERGAIVGRVLDHVEAGDQVKAVLRPRQLLEPPDRDLRDPASARELSRVAVKLDPGHLAVIDELLERAARPAAGVEHPRPRRQRQPIELGPDDPPPAAVPPMVVIDLQRRLHQLLVHRSLMLSAVRRRQRPGDHRRRRETEGELRARTLAALERQLAPHPLGQLAADREAETEARLPAGVTAAMKAPEDLLALVVGDAGPLVADADGCRLAAVDRDQSAPTAPG